MFIRVLFVSALALLFVRSSRATGADQGKSSAPHAAPQVSGKLIGTDGERRVILEYNEKGAHGTFIGNLQAACVIPARTAAIPTPLALSRVPMGSRLTLFYAYHALMTKKGRKTEQVILAIRFDDDSPSLGIKKGETLSCYKSEKPAPTSK